MKNNGLKWYLKMLVHSLKTLISGPLKRGRRQNLTPTQTIRGQINLLNIQANNAYCPRPYSGKATYFYFLEFNTAAFGRTDTRLVWSELAEGGLEVHLLPGHHGTMKREPTVSEIGRKLTDCLERAYLERTDKERQPIRLAA